MRRGIDKGTVPWEHHYPCGNIINDPGILTNDHPY